jgi:sensor histidine kinase YesM
MRRIFMKARLTTIAIHVVGWCLLLLMPYITTYQHIKTFTPNVNSISLLPIILAGMINIVIFYFNSFYLIPRFLFAKKYLQYSFIFFSCLVVSFALGSLIFEITDDDSSYSQAAKPLLTLVRHTAKGYAFQMLVVSFVTSLVLAYSGRLKQIEQEKHSAQIASLKSQINPHFLFNTLNNIYATTLSTSPKSADMVGKLSEMMRYTMRETQKDFVMLEDEISYNNSYIELQRTRLDTSVKIDCNNLLEAGSLRVAPMLLTPFIENAFKHGVSAEQESHIKINIGLQKNELQLFVSNSKVHTQRETGERSGLGIENTKKRLELIYPGRHLLTVKETDEQFEVSLKIHLA